MGSLHKDKTGGGQRSQTALLFTCCRGTDDLGIRSSLLLEAQAQQREQGEASSSPDNANTPFTRGAYSGAVVGGGATTRSAVLALWTLGIGTIFLINRDAGETAEIVRWFKSKGLVEQGLRLVPLGAVEDVEEYLGDDAGEDRVPQLALAVGAIPCTSTTCPLDGV